MRSEEFYNVPQEYLGRVSNDLIFWAIPACLISVLFIGYIYDIFGRRYTLFFSAIFAAICLFLIPLAPSVYPWLYILRFLLATSYAAPNSSPLITDYVKKEHRGSATAFYSLGFIFGDLLVFAVLFNITKFMNPVVGFGLVSFTLVIIGFLFYFMVKEPDMEHLHKTRKKNE